MITCLQTILVCVTAHFIFDNGRHGHFVVWKGRWTGIQYSIGNLRLHSHGHSLEGNWKLFQREKSFLFLVNILYAININNYDSKYCIIHDEHYILYTQLFMVQSRLMNVKKNDEWDLLRWELCTVNWSKFLNGNGFVTEASIDWSVKQLCLINEKHEEGIAHIKVQTLGSTEY